MSVEERRVGSPRTAPRSIQIIDGSDESLRTAGSLVMPPGLAGGTNRARHLGLSNFGLSIGAIRSRALRARASRTSAYPFESPGSACLQSCALPSRTAPCRRAVGHSLPALGGEGAPLAIAVARARAIRPRTVGGCLELAGQAFRGRVVPGQAVGVGTAGILVERCRRLDADFLVARFLDGAHETIGGVADDLELGFLVEDADRADLGLGDVAEAADQRHEPFRIGIAVAADIEPEPTPSPSEATNRALSSALAPSSRRLRSPRPHALLRISAGRCRTRLPARAGARGRGRSARRRSARPAFRRAGLRQVEVLGRRRFA